MLTFVVLFIVPLFVVYAIFAYLFVYGVYQDKDAATELKEAHSLAMAPFTFPFILGQVLMAHHKVNKKALARYKRYEDQRAADEKAKKEFMDELKKMGMVMDFSDIFTPPSRPKESGFAKQFNDMMQATIRNPFNW